jgi:RNA polymerase sigma-70 factor, ECF subfamily
MVRLLPFIRLSCWAAVCASSHLKTALGLFLFLPAGLFIFEFVGLSRNKMPRAQVYTVNDPVSMTNAPDPETVDAAKFEQVVLPHLDSAFNLARWIVRNRGDAEDVAQEAMLRAYRFFGTFHGGDPRAWLLQIVRNTSYTWLQKHKPADLAEEFDERVHGEEVARANPEALAIAASDRKRLHAALENLAPRQREVLVLRELEGCSYKEIATITQIPIGTVMSALARARIQLQAALTAGSSKEAASGL